MWAVRAASLVCMYSFHILNALAVTLWLAMSSSCRSSQVLLCSLVAVLHAVCLGFQGGCKGGGGGGVKATMIQHGFPSCVLAGI